MSRLTWKFVRYAGTAGTAALVDLGGFAVLISGGTGIATASAASFLIATVVNYLLTARLVFHQPASLSAYGKFLLGALAGFAINVGVTVAAASLFEIAPILAKLMGIGVAFGANFAINAVFVFPARRKELSFNRR